VNFIKIQKIFTKDELAYVKMMYLRKFTGFIRGCYELIVHNKTRFIIGKYDLKRETEMVIKKIVVSDKRSTDC
jgi:hypothetical protein